MSTWYMIYRSEFSEMPVDSLFLLFVVGVFAIVGIGMLVYDGWSRRTQRKQTMKQFEEFKNRQE